MTINEVYDYAEKIGTLVFSTIYDNEVHSRIAHFNGYDEDGIYFRTMNTKPYFRQLLSNGKITVCGSTQSNVAHDENGMAIFKPGYTFRLIGEIRNISEEELRTKASNHPDIEMAVKDMDRYVTMRNANFVIYKAKIEIYDYDFELETRNHKLLRTRGEFGGAKYNLAGPQLPIVV